MIHQVKDGDLIKPLDGATREGVLQLRSNLNNDGLRVNVPALYCHFCGCYPFRYFYTISSTTFRRPAFRLIMLILNIWRSPESGR